MFTSLSQNWVTCHTTVQYSVVLRFVKLLMWDQDAMQYLGAALCRASAEHLALSFCDLERRHLVVTYAIWRAREL